MTQLITDDAQATFSGTREVDPRYALDEAALDRWLAANVEGYAGPLTVRQFKGGQSNPTYELVTPGHAYVLRRKPPGTLLPSAHAVDREFTVITALHRQGYPVARPYALCTDDGVLGSMFYVMDKVEGRVLWDLKLPGMAPAQRLTANLLCKYGAGRERTGFGHRGGIGYESAV
ncbi:MAG: phosphotransferase, partial [Brevundimonas sp.]|nr:phosphotransferase [Brevundimonas sp.]